MAGISVSQDMEGRGGGYLCSVACFNKGPPLVRPTPGPTVRTCEDQRLRHLAGRVIGQQCAPLFRQHDMPSLPALAGPHVNRAAVVLEVGNAESDDLAVTTPREKRA